MGTAYRSQCFESPQAAGVAACGGQFPQSVVGEDGTLYTVSCTSADTAGALSLERVADGASAPTAFVVAPAYGSCDALASYTDAVELWGLCLLALTAIWCTRAFVLRQVTGNQ